MIHDWTVFLWGMFFGYNIASFGAALWLFRKGYTSTEQVKDRSKQD